MELHNCDRCGATAVNISGRMATADVTVSAKSAVDDAATNTSPEDMSIHLEVRAASDLCPTCMVGALIAMAAVYPVSQTSMKTMADAAVAAIGG